MSVKSSAYILDNKRTILHIHTNGESTPISKENFATAIAYGQDHTLWAVLIDDAADGTIAYTEDQGKNWHVLQEGIPPVANIAATPGGKCTVLSESGQLFALEKGGKIWSISPEGTALDISVSADSVLWFITKQERPSGGHPIFYTPIVHLNAQPVHGGAVGRKVAGAKNGEVYFITNGKEVASIGMGSMGNLLSEAGRRFAKDIGYCASSDTVWVIEETKSPLKPGQVYYWNKEANEWNDWQAIKGVKAFQIVGAGA